jgi:hypothetical protein
MALGARRPGFSFHSISCLSLSGIWFPRLQNEGVGTWCRSIRGSIRTTWVAFETLHILRPCPGGDSVHPGWGRGVCVFPVSDAGFLPRTAGPEDP